MSKTDKIVLSASRRTDIPAFYLNWFMERIEKGSFPVVNPYNRVTKTIDASSSHVHTIVFWSKNFSPFLQSGTGHRLLRKGYHLFFNFTVNSECQLLEPAIPRLEERIGQLAQLCDEFSPETVNWRFDPICFYRDKNGVFGNNLSDFEFIAQNASRVGITRCVTSFADDYAKIKRRTASLWQNHENAPLLVDPGREKKIDILTRMERVLQPKGICLLTCCEKELMAALPRPTTISENACIPGKRLQKMFQGTPVTKKDPGQRSKKGCRCTQSVDIGSYDSHPCFHNCRFCYANPAMDTKTTFPPNGSVEQANG